jgi:hypothetical protein
MAGIKAQVSQNAHQSTMFPGCKLNTWARSNGFKRLQKSEPVAYYQRGAPIAIQPPPPERHREIT